ncbi:Protein of unknown function (DUF3558) [Prauserella aidingensis]|uniref:DUF3558 domain-containing protein n=1 Tax=Prauserella aidingensis TaxID=387890 RepID=UPI0020A2AFC9|nr:DUF3558 domain-containing protein [Prauserella aidingensis]MCP2252931.1 Protein of unknown function (DUF3558) [Prauserella aidingensis]
MKYLVRVVALAAVSLVAAACGSESDGQAQPEPSGVGPSSASAAPSSAEDGGQELPHSGAPAVTNPLPKSVLDGDPCTDALTQAQAKKFLGDAVTSVDADEPRLGPGCRWSNRSVLASFTLNYDTAVGQGLSATYANAKTQEDNFAEIDPIGGFPAVQYWDDGQERNCNTVVGVADEYAVGISLTLGTNSAEEGEDPCEASRTVMERVVGNLKAKA